MTGESEEYTKDNWRKGAACHKALIADPTLRSAWFDQFDEEYERGKKICLGCPVRDLCLQDALNDPEAEGLRGGYWFDSGILPVSDAREIRDTMGLRLSRWQRVSKSSWYA